MRFSVCAQLQSHNCSLSFSRPSPFTPTSIKHADPFGQLSGSRPPSLRPAPPNLHANLPEQETHTTTVGSLRQCGVNCPISSDSLRRRMSDRPVEWPTLCDVGGGRHRTMCDLPESKASLADGSAMCGDGLVACAWITERPAKGLRTCSHL